MTSSSASSARDRTPARVVVLAGGGSHRLGRDKLVVDLGGRTVLERLLDGVREVLPDLPVVAVGPRRRLAPGLAVTWVLEEPPGGGPVAGLAAGLTALAALTALTDDDVVAVLAGDQPLVAPALRLLLDAPACSPDADGVLGTDASGRDQPLLALYRVGALRRAVGPAPAGRRVRDVVAALALQRVPLPDGTTLDVDTEDDVTAARERVAGPVSCGPSTPRSR